LTPPLDQRTIGSDHLSGSFGDQHRDACPRPLSRAFFCAAKQWRPPRKAAGK
jgi:hypothetical protein